MSLNQIEHRKEDFCQLGDWLRTESIRSELAEKAFQQNPWFTIENSSRMLKAIGTWLHAEQLTDWLTPYPLQKSMSKTIGVIMAGNIPLAGFHDFLSVLITGNKIKAKLSSQDQVLLKSITTELIRINPEWKHRIEFSDQIKSVDGVIATGSNNTARYFEYYFRSIPMLLRHNRSSVAVLTGQESDEELSDLATDVLSYFGLGCRNVSKIFIPVDLSMDRITAALFPWSAILDHHKYANNYTYQRAILLMDQQPFTDTGFCVLRESDLLFSPVGVIHYKRYTEIKNVNDWISLNHQEIQCTVGNAISGSIPFGHAQRPRLSDYADHIDTIRFITEQVGAA